MRPTRLHSFFPSVASLSHSLRRFPLPVRLPCSRRLPVGARGLRTSAPAEARILASDPIEAVCKDILSARGHELVTVDKTPKVSRGMGVLGASSAWGGALPRAG